MSFKLIHIGYYKCPKGRRPSSVQIREGAHYIEMMVNGRVLFDDGNGEREFSCGAIFWHVSGDQTIWKSAIDAPYECLTVLFEVDNPALRVAPRVSLWEPHECKIFSDEVLRAYHNDAFDRKVLSDYVYSRLRWASYCDTMNRSVMESLPPPLAKAMATLSSSFDAELDVASLATSAKVSVPYLHALFKRHLGTSPHQALLERRLQEARKLLASSDLNLKTIAFNCGFPCVEHFCRVFKRRFNCTAAEFRNSNTPSAILKGD